jgi:hypothetical protein
MRHAVSAALLALLAASPAFATGGYTCRPVSGAGPVVSMGFGHAISSPVFVAQIQEGKRTLLASNDPKHPLRIGQSWMDRQYLWLDVIDAQATRFEAKLRATFQPKLRGRPAIGTLVRGGRTYRVRCEES